MKDYKLTELFEEYSKSNGLLKEAYGTIYKMYGGKKEIPEYSVEMDWFLSAIERFNRAYKKYRTIEMNRDKELQGTIDEELKTELIRKYNQERFEFFESRFKSILVYLEYRYNVKTGTKKENGLHLGYWVVLKNGRPLINSTIYLSDTYGFGDTHKAIIDIFVELRGCLKGEYCKKYELQNVMNEINFVFNHTKLSFKAIED